MDELTRLATAAARGDPQAVTGFVRATQQQVWRLCAHLVDRDAANDLTQETYLRALPALPRFRGEASVRTWLLSIARRVCADEINRRRRNAEQPSASLPERPQTDPAGHVDIHQLINALEPDRRTAFVLTQILGCSYQEAADITDTPIGTIRSRVARARDDLITAFRTAGTDHDATSPTPGTRTRPR